METKELKIQIPEGYEIDRERSTFEKIVFKKKDTKPRSWEEYRNLQIINSKKGYRINGLTSRIEEVHWYNCSDADSWRNVLPSKELAEAFRAMMQLMSLRREWIKNWRPVWGGSVYQYCIVVYDGGMYVDTFTICQHPLSFPTEAMANEFLKCFKDLLEIAKPLI